MNMLEIGNKEMLKKIDRNNSGDKGVLLRLLIRSYDPVKNEWDAEFYEKKMQKLLLHLSFVCLQQTKQRMGIHWICVFILTYSQATMLHNTWGTHYICFELN